MNRRRNVCVMERSVLVFGAALIVFFLAAFLISDRIEASSMTSDQQSYQVLHQHTGKAGRIPLVDRRSLYVFRLFGS